jgi:hypothetical protein
MMQGAAVSQRALGALLLAILNGVRGEIVSPSATSNCFAEFGDVSDTQKQLLRIAAKHLDEAERAKSPVVITSHPLRKRTVTLRPTKKTKVSS